MKKLLFIILIVIFANNCVAKAEFYAIECSDKEGVQTVIEVDYGKDTPCSAGERICGKVLEAGNLRSMRPMTEGELNMYGKDIIGK